jgi:hypothetical protein
MSGAAGIAAAKNRRSKTELSKRPIVDCNTLNGTCNIQNKTQKSSDNLLQPQIIQNRLLPEDNLVDPTTLKILGPMPTPNVLKIHEQRLNRIDEQLSRGVSIISSVPVNTESGDDNNKVAELEEKVHILEEVIMNLQLTLTNLQSFAMETNLAMMKMKREKEETENSVVDVKEEHNTVLNNTENDEIITTETNLINNLY